MPSFPRVAVIPLSRLAAIPLPRFATIPPAQPRLALLMRRCLRLSRLRPSCLILSCLMLLASPLVGAKEAPRALRKGMAAGGAEVDYRAAAAAFHRLRRAEQATPAQWSRVAKALVAIHGAYPTHRRAPDSLYSAALALKAAREAGGPMEAREEALARFEQFVNKYPRHRLADDSLMQVAELYGAEAADGRRATLTYRRVLVTYPNGDQAPLARDRVRALETAWRRKTGPAPARNAAVAADGQAGQAAAAEAAEGRPATVKRLMYSSLADFTRIILTTDRSVSYEYSRLPAKEGKPARLYIDLADTLPMEGLAPEHTVDDGVLEKIRIGPYRPRTTRVVFDLKTMERFEVKNLHLPYEKKIIVDLYPRAEHEPPRSGERALPPPPVASLDDLSLRNTLGLKVRNLVIDPGHGGRDPGAVAFGLREKNVALRLSRELREVFRRKRPDIRVELTRDEDRFIPLGRRPAIAKRLEADLFVSIHLNAHTEERFFGIETYFLNLTTDASALRVAARENATTEKQIGDLNAILTDLLRDTNIVESGKLARTLQLSLVGGLKGSYPVRDLGVKQAPFMVLIGAEMPSVLVEAGFLTNRRENRRLRKPAYLKRLAEGIYEGLRKYIQEQTYALERPLSSGPPTPQDS